MLLGTWRTSDAEKNHTHKIGKRKKKRKKGKKEKEKRSPMMNGMDGLGKCMAFCVERNRIRKGKHTKEGRNYDTIRGGRRRSRSEWHE